MELTHEFEVAIPVDEAWVVLTDVERIAPCLPGAELNEVEGDEYRGVVKVKVGPITASYKGAARFSELDEAQHRAVLRAEGRDTRGQGNASATITATLEPSEIGTKVGVVTDLTITGKVAQFGRGVLADVSEKLLGQFVANLESTVLSPEGPTAATTPKAATGEEPGAGGTAEESSGGDGTANGASGEAPPGVRKIESVPAEPVDLLDVAGSSVMQRLAPILAAASVLLVVRILISSMRRRRRRRRGGSFTS